MKYKLLGGRELAGVFDRLNPFSVDGQLKPEGERRTLLAPNANLPLEVQQRAFAMAAAAGKGSPLLVQMSHSSLGYIGGDPESLGLDAGRAQGAANPLDFASRVSRLMLEQYAQDYGATHLAISLDHFKVPPPEPARHPGAGEEDEALYAAVFYYVCERWLQRATVLQESH